MSVSKRILSELRKEKIKFFANDNISKYVTTKDLIEIEKELEEKLSEVLDILLIDREKDHNTKDTAKRVAKMFIHETFSGRYKPMPKVTEFPNSNNYDGLYVTGPIAVRSVCAHHLQNIVGKCWIGVKPEKDVIGLSKFNRIVEWICERPQIQEEMTIQIANQIQDATKTQNIAVVVKAEHYCMIQRGVKAHESDMTTAIMRGIFEKETIVRNEFYHILNGMKGYN